MVLDARVVSAGPGIKDLVAVAREGGEEGAGVRVPQLHGLVGAAREAVPAVHWGGGGGCAFGSHLTDRESTDNKQLWKKNEVF